MMKILTPEQIQKHLPSDAFHLAEDDLKSGQNIARAQAKLTLQEVVAWLEENNVLLKVDKDKWGLCLTNYHWQKLKELAK